MKGFAILLLLLIAFFAIGCSGETGPATTPETPRSEVAVGNSAQMLGLYNVEFDLENLTAVMSPLRAADAHYNVTGFFSSCADCVQITVASFDPVTRVAIADLKLKNPSTHTAYDLRTIIYTSDFGHLFQNPCNWSPLFDIPQGYEINPFRTYGKSNPNRAFPPGWVETQNFNIYIPDPAHWEQFIWAIEASFPGNAEEPYRVKDFNAPDLPTAPGSSVGISVHVTDWQNDIDHVDISVPAITGEEWTPLTLVADPTWGAYLVNNKGATPGVYGAWVRATSAGSGSAATYASVEITVVP